MLLHDLFGSPFSVGVVEPGWLACIDALVVRLAQNAYDTRQVKDGSLESARLTVLADALEEAGCDDPNILEHLRNPEPHDRGCWPLDALLQRG